MTSSAKITNAILEHIFQQLGVYGNTAVSIHHPAFLTEKTVEYSNDIDTPRLEKVWACQTEISSKKLSVISTELNGGENFAVVKFDSNPAYGLYLYTEFEPSQWDLGLDRNKPISYDGFLATQLKEKTWIPTTVYLQATFLAGMEQLRDVTSKYDKAKDVEGLFGLLKEFIAYREAYCNGGNLANQNQ